MDLPEEAEEEARIDARALASVAANQEDAVEAASVAEIEVRSRTFLPSRSEVR